YDKYGVPPPAPQPRQRPGHQHQRRLAGHRHDRPTLDAKHLNLGRGIEHGPGPRRLPDRWIDPLQPLAKRKYPIRPRNQFVRIHPTYPRRIAHKYTAPDMNAEGRAEKP